MDYGDILRRTWRITWDHKYLWWLGLLTALGSGGSSGNVGRRFNSPGGFGGEGVPGPGGPDLGPLSGMEGGILAAIIAVLCVLFIIAVVIAVVSIIARGGLINAVNQIEDAEKSSFREGWQAGRKTFWRMFGVGLVGAIPAFIMAFVVAALAVAGVFGSAGLSELGTDPRSLWAAGGLALICLIPILCIGALASLALAILRPFADRAVVLEDERVFASYRRGWDILRENLGDSLVVGIINFLISFVIGIVVAIPFIAVGIAFLAAAGVGAAMGGPESLSSVGIPIAIALGCGFLVFLVVALAVGAVKTTFSSGLWTLAYREFMGREMVLDTGGAEPTPAT